MGEGNIRRMNEYENRIREEAEIQRLDGIIAGYVELREQAIVSRRRLSAVTPMTLTDRIKTGMDILLFTLDDRVMTHYDDSVLVAINHARDASKPKGPIESVIIGSRVYEPRAMVNFATWDVILPRSEEESKKTWLITYKPTVDDIWICLRGNIATLSMGYQLWGTLVPYQKNVILGGLAWRVLRIVYGVDNTIHIIKADRKKKECEFTRVGSARDSRGAPPAQWTVSVCEIQSPVLLYFPKGQPIT